LSSNTQHTVPGNPLAAAFRAPCLPPPRPRLPASEAVKRIIGGENRSYVDIAPRHASTMVFCRKIAAIRQPMARGGGRWSRVVLAGECCRQSGPLHPRIMRQSKTWDEHGDALMLSMYSRDICSYLPERVRAVSAAAREVRRSRVQNTPALTSLQSPLQWQPEWHRNLPWHRRTTSCCSACRTSDSARRRIRCPCRVS
jgi:hypothetical protein